MSSIATLMYHEVSNVPESEIQNFYNAQKGFCVTETTFNQHMGCIANDKSIKIIRPAQLGLKNSHNYSRLVMITFDDGFTGNIVSALPVLNKYNLKAVFFLIADKIGKHPYMQWSDVRKLDASGMIIGSHGFSHKIIAGRGKKFLQKELTRSKEKIEQEIGKRIDSLSFPHGAYDQASLDFAENAGYENIFTSDYGFAIKKRKNINLIPRINVPRSLPDKNFKALIFPGRRQFYFAKMKFLLKKSIKKIIGFENYLKLYTKLYHLSK